MKKILIIIVLILNSVSIQAQFVKENGKLGLNGTQLVNEKNEPLVLRGVSFGWHNFWPRFYNKEAVKWLKEDWNANVVRAAMGIDLDDNCYLTKPKESKAIIEAVLDAGHTGRNRGAQIGHSAGHRRLHTGKGGAGRGFHTVPAR